MQIFHVRPWNLFVAFHDSPCMRLKSWRGAIPSGTARACPFVISGAKLYASRTSALVARGLVSARPTELKTRTPATSMSTIGTYAPRLGRENCNADFRSFTVSVRSHEPTLTVQRWVRH